MDAVEVTGMILNTMPVNEADRRLSLLTKELGRISCFARNARRPTSELVGATRTFAFGRFFLYPGKGAYTLQRAEIDEYFEPLVSDVAGTAYACYFAELVGHFTHEGSDEGRMLALLYYSLKALLRPSLPDPLVKRITEFKVLSLFGVAPSFEICPSCKKAVEKGFFSPGRMQLLCEACASEKAGFPLSSPAVYMLNFISKTPPEKLFSFNVSRDVLEETGAVIDFLIERNSDRVFKTREVLAVLAPDND